MSRCLLLTILVTTGISSFGQFNVSYNFLRPVREQGKHIKQSHGLITGFDIPLGKSPFSVGPELGFNVYGIKTVEMDLPFQNGYITDAKVNYSTSMVHYAAVLRFQPWKGKVNPYAALRGGRIHYHGNMRIDDPEDPLGCKALEERVLLSDGAWIASFGGGVRINLRNTQDLYIDIGGFYTMHGAAEYLKIATHHTANDPKSRLYTVKFQHIPTGEVHEHVVGQTYHTKGQMVDLRAGISYRFGHLYKRTGEIQKAPRTKKQDQNKEEKINSKGHSW